MLELTKKRSELNKEKEMSLQEKTKLKDTIKKYESEFSKTNGRSLNKEDREYHKEDFERYKVLINVNKFFFLLAYKILVWSLWNKDSQSQVKTDRRTNREARNAQKVAVVYISNHNVIDVYTNQLCFFFAIFSLKLFIFNI